MTSGVTSGLYQYIALELLKNNGFDKNIIDDAIEISKNISKSKIKNKKNKKIKNNEFKKNPNKEDFKNYSVSL